MPLQRNRPSSFFDEPFAGIDPIAVADIQVLVKHLAKRGIGVLITDHNVRETLSIVDKAYILNEGKIMVEGPSEKVAADPIARKYYLGKTLRCEAYHEDT